MPGTLRDMFNKDNIALTNKVSRLMDEVRKDITKICKLDKSLKGMAWEEKMSKLPSDAWMIEQMMFQIENYMKRQSGLDKWKTPLNKEQF